MIPPLSLWIYVDRPDRERPVRVWLPLFLLWIILLPFVLLALTATILTDTVLLLIGQAYHRYTALLLGCFQVLADTRGLTIRVNGDADVNITIA